MKQLAGTFADNVARNDTTVTGGPSFTIRMPWDADHLVFTVREPFPSKTTRTELVIGRVSTDAPLEVKSHMPERGVIFSDGIESDFLEFSSGTKATIGVAERRGRLVTGLERNRTPHGLAAPRFSSTSDSSRNWGESTPFWAASGA